MVAALIRMRLALQVNEMRRSTMLLVGTIINYVFSLGGIVGAIILGVVVGFLPNLDPGALAAGQLLATAFVFILWAVTPVFLTGVDMTMDPARFAMYPVPARKLVASIAASTVVSPPVLMTLAFFIGTALLWLQWPAVMILLLLLAPAMTFTAVGTGYATASWASTLLGRRRGRDMAAIIGMVLLMSFGVIINSVGYSVAVLWDEFPRILQIAGWTPFGFAATAAENAAGGQWGMALLKALLVIVWAAAIFFIWVAGVRNAMANVTSREISTAKKAKGLGPFNLYPSTPTGAVAARSLVYWLKDPRYSSSLLIIPLFPVIMYVSMMTAEDFMPVHLLIPGVVGFIGMLMGIALMNEIAADNTAVSLHIISGVSGRADRAGRIIALLTFAIPGIVLMAVVMALLTDGWDLLPVAIGVGIGGLLGVSGVASVLSAWIVYPMAKPGESPFASQKGGFLKGMTVSLISMVSAAIIMTGPAILGFMYFDTGNMIYSYLSMLVGLLIGAVLLLLGIHFGGKLFDKRAPELYQQVLVL